MDRQCLNVNHKSSERLIRAISLSWSFGANGLSRRLNLGLFFWTPWAIFEVALIFMALYYHRVVVINS